MKIKKVKLFEKITAKLTGATIAAYFWWRIIPKSIRGYYGNF
jgi:hypothetical protein